MSILDINTRLKYKKELLDKLHVRGCHLTDLYAIVGIYYKRVSK